MKTTRHIGDYTISGADRFWTVSAGARPVVTFGTLLDALAWCRANPPKPTLPTITRAEASKRYPESVAVALSWHDSTDPMEED